MQRTTICFEVSFEACLVYNRAMAPFLCTPRGVYHDAWNPVVLGPPAFWPHYSAQPVLLHCVGQDMVARIHRQVAQGRSATCFFGVAQARNLRCISLLVLFAAPAALTVLPCAACHGSQQESQGMAGFCSSPSCTLNPRDPLVRVC